MPYKEKYKEVDFQKQWYQKNKEKIKERHAAYRKEHKPTLVAWLADYKSRISCMDCGEVFPACLHFHHRNASEKRFTISAAIRMCVCVEEILIEIAKCDVVCANCHTKRHYGEAGREDRHLTVAQGGKPQHRFESDVSPQYKFDWG